MNRTKAAEQLTQLLSEHERNTNILRSMSSRLDWLARAVPLLRFNPTLYQAAQESADILARPGFTSKMYSQMEGRILFLTRQAVAELRQSDDIDQLDGDIGLEWLMHPLIRKSGYPQFLDGHYRDAVLNAVIGLGDHIRKLSLCSQDGAKLINEVFGGANPILIFSEMETESGRNEQAGFHKILLGAFEGIRNPKAHSLAHDLTKLKAAQYLVFISLLARRVDEAKRNEK